MQRGSTTKSGQERHGGVSGPVGFLRSVQPVRCCLLIAIVFALLAAPSAAQDSASFGFLVRQPLRGRALPVLPANSVRFIEAQYDVGGVPVDVFIVPAADTTGRDLVAIDPEEWDPVVCPQLTMQRFERTSAQRYVMRSERDRYGLFISTSLDADTVCVFAASFIETFEFFLDELEGELSEGPPPEFPAVIDLTQ